MIYRGPLQYYENPDNGDDDSLCEQEILDASPNAELAKPRNDFFLVLKKFVVLALLLLLAVLAMGATFYWKPGPLQHTAKGTATPTTPAMCPCSF